MRRLLTGYAIRFDHRHRRNGKLFQNRYKSILCQEDPYLSGLIRDFDQLGRYRFSGHSVILGKRKNDWQDVDYVLDYFAQRRAAARKRHLDHLRQGIEMGKRPDLVGGGLIGSFGGWSEVKSLRKVDIRPRG